MAEDANVRGIRCRRSGQGVVDGEMTDRQLGSHFVALVTDEEVGEGT